jgi:hypothetical protein
MNAPDSLATHTLQFGTANILMVPRASTSTANLAAASHSSARVRLIYINLRLIKCSQLSVHGGCVGRLVMLRYILTALAVIILLTASLIPEDAFARRGGGGGYYRRGYGAAAVGAAAAGAYYGGSYGNYGCYYDPYGRYTCPQQYPY